MLKFSLAFFGSFLLVSPSVSALNTVPNSHQLPQRNNAELLVTQRTANTNRERIQQLSQEIQQLVNNKQWDLALENAKQMTELYPNIYLSWSLLGVVHLQFEQFNEAVITLEKARSLAPDNETKKPILSALGTAYQQRGIQYFQQKQFEIALSDLNKAINLRPNVAESYYIRGLLYSTQEKFDLALLDLNKAISINPNLAGAYDILGVIYAMKEDFTKALNNLEKAAQLYRQQQKPEQYKKTQELIQVIRQQMN